MLEKHGCQCEMTAATGDQGADLIVHYKGRKIAVQVKRWAGAVGNSAVQEVIAAQKLYHCNEAWVVTNSRFTKSAREVAVAFGVVLIEGTELGRLQSFLDRRLGRTPHPFSNNRPEVMAKLRELRLDKKNPPPPKGTRSVEKAAVSPDISRSTIDSYRKSRKRRANRE